MDQVFAQHLGTTYCESLVLSYADGVGGNTASRNSMGADIHAIGNPAQALRELLPPVEQSELDNLRRRLHSRKTVVDGVNEHLRDFTRTLSRADRQRMEQFVESLHGLEQRIGYRERGLMTPRPAVDESRFSDWKREKESLAEHIDIMTDLMVIGFQSDTTRVSTYITGHEDGHGPLGDVREFATSIGAPFGHGHDLWHQGSGAPKDSKIGVVLAHRDRLLVEGLVRFIDKLKAIPAADGTLLDHTQILLGGMQGLTHTATDGPTLVAGGKRLGWRHGQYKVYWTPRDQGGPAGGQTGGPKPLSNLYLTMLQQAGCQVESFKESTGALSELLV